MQASDTEPDEHYLEALWTVVRQSMASPSRSGCSQNYSLASQENTFKNYKDQQAKQLAAYVLKEGKVDLLGQKESHLLRRCLVRHFVVLLRELDDP